MGKTKTIKDAAVTNNEFQEFLEDIQKKLKDKCDAEAQDFTTKVSSFYTDSNYDQLLIAEGEKWDYRMSDEFGLNTLTEKITEMVESIFGVSNIEFKEEGSKEIDSTDNGKVVMAVSAEVLAALKMINLYKKMAATVATNFLIKMMDVFGTSLNVTTTHNYSSQSIAPGLTLHIVVYTDSYENSRFLNQKKIVENYMRFKLIYSYKLAQTISDMNEITKLISLIDENTSKLVVFDKQLMTLACDMNVPMETIIMFQNRSVLSHSILDDSRKQMDAIIAAHMAQSVKSVKNYSRSAAERIPNERLAIQQSVIENYQ